MDKSRRLQSEYKRMQQNPCSNVSIQPCGDSNFMRWEGQIFGPINTAFEGGIFPILVEIPENFPYKPPKVRFLCKMYHPNISKTSGYICLNILQNDWTPALSLQKALLCVCSLLENPNCGDPVEPEISDMYLKNRPLYDQTVREYTIRYGS